MATTKEFHDYVLGQLQKTGDATTRKMMGEGSSLGAAQIVHNDFF